VHAGILGIGDLQREIGRLDQFRVFADGFAQFEEVRHLQNGFAEVQQPRAACADLAAEIATRTKHTQHSPFELMLAGHNALLRVAG